MEAIINSLSIWSYFFLFGIIFFECAGMPLPGFSVALLAAALAGQGRLSFGLVFGITLVGATLGGIVGYLVGLHGGRTLIERYGRYVFITPQRFATAEKLFQKHGNKAVLLGRFFPLLCFLAGIISGITRLNYRRFLIYNFVGALLWCNELILGYFFGRSLHILSKAFNNFFMALAILGLIVGLVVLVRRKIRTSQAWRRPIPLSLEEPTER